MTDMTTLSRRRLLALGAAATALAGAAFAQSLEEKGYAIGDMALGDPDAPVTIIEYASLTCPHCATFHNESWPTIKRDYVETGKVRFVFRDVYFDQFGLWGAMLARCGGEGPFFGYLDMLMKRQREWAQSGGVDELMRIGRLGGLSDDRMQACLSDEDFMRALVEDYQRNVEADGVRSTPTFFINGDRFSGAIPASEMAGLIEERL
jgi:protein-disulfide isomerase